MNQNKEVKKQATFSLSICFKILILLIITSYLIGMYYVLRYNSLILDSDAIMLTNCIKGLLQTGDISKSISIVFYSNGIFYQMFSYIFILINNIDVYSYHQIFRPLLGTITIFSGILFFYSFKNECKYKVWALALFLLSPITLFEITRASHVFLSFSFFLLSWFFFLNYIKSRDYRYLILLIIINFSFAITNQFNGLILTICEIGILTYVFIEIDIRKKLDYIGIIKNPAFLAALIGIIYILGVIYLYALAFRMMVNLSSLIFDSFYYLNTIKIPSAYTYISTWKNPLIYWGVIILYNITVLPLSLIIFILVALKSFKNEIQLNLFEKIVLLIFGFLGFSIVTTILIDFFGPKGIGSNVQLRLTLFIIPFSIVLILLFFNKIFPKIRGKKIFLAMGIAFCILFLIGSLIYITSDPYFSKNWRFTDTYEKTSILWIYNNEYESYTIWGGDPNVNAKIELTVRLFLTDLSKMKEISFSSEKTDLQYLINSPLIINHISENSLNFPNYHFYNKIYSNQEQYSVYFFKNLS